MSLLGQKVTNVVHVVLLFSEEENKKLSQHSQSYRVKLKQSEALITACTYDPLIRKSFQTDPNGITTYYEYDDFGRLKLVRDHNNNIIQRYDYNYAQ
jgi:YD repeat-containing protein